MILSCKSVFYCALMKCKVVKRTTKCFLRQQHSDTHTMHRFIAKSTQTQAHTHTINSVTSTGSIKRLSADAREPQGSHQLLPEAISHPHVLY